MSPMIVKDITRREARTVLTSADGWRAWQAACGGSPCELAFDPHRDVWTVSVATDEGSSVSSLSVRVMTDGPTFQCWQVPDVPAAVDALGAFARNGQWKPQDSGLDAIEAYVIDQWPRALLSVTWSGELLASLWANAAARHSAAREPRALRSACLHPLDLFDKFGFDEGDALDEHLQALRAEGWSIGADELLWAVIQEEVLPRLDPRPLLVGVGSAHNNVRALLEGHDLDVDEEDLDVVRALTLSWPTTVDVDAANIMAIGRAAAAPLTARIRALEAVLVPRVQPKARLND
jgi:hypothetical protein